MRINEVFMSIQGEGLSTGLPTVFVRTQGCNLRCSYCDTKYSYYSGKECSIHEVVRKIEKFGIKRVCLTGGEPLLQEDADCLVQDLIKKDYEVSIETNGSINLKKIKNHKSILFSLDIKCPSSGSQKMMDLNNLRLVKKKDQVKFVIGDKKDLDFACNIVYNKRLCSKTNVFFHPVGGIDAKNIVKEVLKRKMDVRVGLQIHKIIWGVRKKGV